MAQFGTNTTLDLLASRFQFVNEKMSDYGEQRAADGIQTMLAAHNLQFADLMADLCGTTTNRLGMFGTGDIGQMIELDETGTPPPQKQRFGVVVGYPLRKFGYSWQGTRQFFRKATIGDLIGQTQAMMDADRKNLINEVRKAIFIPTNYTFSDDLVDHITATPLPVRRLVNADGLAIPPGPNGETFDGNTHTHYLGAAAAGTPAASDVVALKNTVFEHYNGGDAIIAINVTNQNAVIGMTPNFVQMLPTQVVGSIQANQVPGYPIDIIPINNRQIGFFDGVPVWIKPWMPANYIACYLRGNKRVCMIRTDPDTNTGGDLILNYKDENYPLRAEAGEREFGVGVLERTGMAVLDTAHTTYTAPSLLSF